MSGSEIQKAVKQFISATLSARKTMEGQAQNLGGNWLAANDLNFSERYLAAVKRVSHVDVQRVAREYLSAENRTVYALLPEGATPKSASEEEINADHAIQMITLPNGLKLLVKEDSRLPFFKEGSSQKRRQIMVQPCCWPNSSSRERPGAMRKPWPRKLNRLAATLTVMGAITASE